MRRLVALLALVVGCGTLACAPAVEVDSNETVDSGTTLPLPPQAEFDPGADVPVLPLPNVLAMNPTTGLVNAPASCNESATAAALRTNGINSLDGFGNFKPALQATFSDPVDTDSLTDKVKLFRVKQGATPDNPATAAPVPFVTLKTTTARFPANCDAAGVQMIDALTIVPTVPLSDNATYVVVLLNGIKVDDGVAGAANGEDFMPSVTWQLVRQAEAPVVIDADGNVTTNLTPFDEFDATDADGSGVADSIESLQGLSVLWGAHSGLLQFVSAVPNAGISSRHDILVGWGFKTQTIMAPLDPAGSGPAGGTDALTAGFVSPMGTGTPIEVPAQSGMASGGDGAQLVNDSLCVASGQAPDCSGLCDFKGGSVPCSKVEKVLVGAFGSPNFQITMANTSKGPWSSPLAPAAAGTNNIAVLMFTPTGTMPTAGWPTVVFGHGLGRSKNDTFAIASQLAAAGIQTVAMDWRASGSRQVQTSTNALLGCSGTPTPSSAPQCFEQILSGDLLTTRDNLRQSVIDFLALVQTVKNCATQDCGELEVDPARLGYMGQSLGALIGVTAVTQAPDIKAAVLNVGGVGWIDIVNETQTDSIKCPLIDALIVAGVLTGNIWTGSSTPSAALCKDPALATNPQWLYFANVARWMLDPIDGANFSLKLRAKTTTKVLLQEVIGDMVVPNVSTTTFGSLLGLAPNNANVYCPDFATNPTSCGLAAPSTGVGVANGWVRYTSGGGNDFTHGSLLAPANATTGMLGTAQMQTDAVTFLVMNL